MSTMSLFEREMREQIAAAEAAVTDAERRSDPLLIQAVRSHLEGLLSLARRNGISFPVEGTDTTISVEPAPAVVPAG